MKPEANVSEPESIRNREFFSTRLALRLIEPVSVRNNLIFTPRPEVIVNALEGFKVQDVATPLCSVQEIDVVLEA